jgi:YD repeat-containing protein
MFSFRLWRAFLRQLKFAPRKRPVRRLRFEQLEDRTVPATVTWTASGSGNWDVGSNWSTGVVPGSGDTAVINTTGAATITLKNGDNYSIQSVTTSSTDTLSFSSGGQLTVTTGASTLSGPLVMTGGYLAAIGSTASLTANATTTISYSSLYAESGGSLSLPHLTSYTTNGTFEAENAGSVLNVSALTTVTLGTGGWSLDAYTGGTLNISGLTSLSSSNSSYNITDTGGSTVTDPNLTTLHGVSVNLDGTDTQVAKNWTSLTNANFVVTGGSYTLPNLTSVNEGSLYAESGGQLSLPNLTSYLTNGTFEAENSGSVLNLSALTTVTLGTGGWSLNAYTGGTLNISGLTSISSSNNSYHLTDTGSSTIVAPNLTTLNGFSLDFDGTDSPQIAQSWTSLTNSTFVVTGGSYTLPNLTNVNYSSLYAESGGKLSLPNLTSYITNGTFEAENSGSVLNVSALTTVTLGTGGWSLNAYTGGTLNISGLTSISSSNNSYHITDTGASTIIAPNLTTLNGVSANFDGTDSPQIAQTWTSFTNSNFVVTGGSYTLPNLTNVNQASLYAESGATLSLPHLTSYTTNGTFEAENSGSVLNVSGLTTVTLGTGGWSLNAYTGGTLNISGLTSISSSNNSYHITDTGASTIVAPNLTTLSGVSANFDGTDSPQIAQTWTSFTNSTFTITGGSYTLPNLTNVNYASLYAENGGKLSLPNLTSYTTNGTFEAENSGSVLNVSALTTATLGTGGWSLNAYTGGTLNISGLTSISSSNSSYHLTDTGSSTITDPNLATLYGVNVSLDGTDPNVSNDWTTFLNGSLSVTGGTNNFPKLADAVISLSSGVTLNLPVLTSGDITMANGTQANIQSLLASFPVSGTSNATVTIPASQGLIFTLKNTGTLTGTTFNVGAGSDVLIHGDGTSAGSYLGTTTFNVANSGSVDLTDGQTTIYGGTLTGSGAGTVVLASGNLYPASGGVTLNFPAGMFQWTGGGMELSVGNATNTGTINLSGSNFTQIYADGTLFNAGTMIQTGSGNFELHSDNVSPTTFNNQAGGQYLMESDAGITNYANTNAIVNAGAIRKTAGTGTSPIQITGVLNNTGTIEADSGTLSLSPTSITQASGSTLSGGTWNALSGATLKFPTGTSITSNTARLGLSGSGASITGISGLAANSGSFTVGVGAAFTTAGNFSNTGTLTVGGKLKVTGAFTQTSTGVLNEQFDGTPASGQFGQTQAAGSAIAGTLSLGLVSGFTPLAGEGFPILTYASESGNFSTVNGLGSVFTASLTPTAFNLNDASANTVDLATTSVTGPTAAVVGQPITVNWQVTDQGAQNASGTWQDSVYLSPTPTLSPASILLGAVPHSSGLTAGNSYSASLTAAVPALAPGNDYILVVADSLYQESDLNRSNNTMAATTGQMQISVPSLTLGAPTNDSFSAAGQGKVYQVSVPAGGSLSVALASAASSGATALYVSQGVVPTPSSFQYAATANQPSQSVTVPQILAAGTYYVLATSVSGAAATSAFTLTATQSSGLSVTSLGSTSAGNAGNATIEITGANFAPNASASLTLGAATINASAIDYINPGQIYATFNLTGATPGSYTLGVQQGGQSANASSLFQVTTGSSGGLSVSLSVPQYIRSGRTGNIVVTYTNTSNNDLTAPLLSIASTNAKVLFSTPDNPNSFVSVAQVLAVAPTGPAGILLPGESGQLMLTLQSNDSVDSDAIPISVSQVQPGQTINWSSLQSQSRPSTIPSAGWSVIWSNLTTLLGSTTTTYNAALAQAATYLSNLGESPAHVSDVSNLWSFLVSQADDEFPTSALASTVDASLPVPGSLSLSLDRTDLADIAGRYTSGIFGLGWTTSWQTSIAVDGAGNVTLFSGGTAAEFPIQANGSYLDTAGETGTLTFSSGVYTFTSASGIQYVFLANGLLNYEQDPNGNRITLGYNGSNQLTTLTYSNPADSAEPTQTLTLTYNAQGYVSLSADGTGNVWTYTYDGAGHLLSVAAPGSLTTTYAYNTSGDGELTNALLSATNPDGSVQNYSYSAATGQLIGTSGAGNGNAVTYAYPGEGEVQATDLSNEQTTVWYNDFGSPGMIENALGGVSTNLYDNNGDLISATNAAGATTRYTYNAGGDVTSTVNALGQTASMAYNALGELLSLTDANSNTTSYSYSSAGDLLSVTNPDGASQSFVYDPLGDMTGTIEQNGDPVAYAYNSQGLVSAETFADGSSERFTYDARGDVLTALTFNSSGALTGTTTLTYNAANQLTSITYPGGQYLDFTYNSVGQRTQSVDQSGFTVNYTYNSAGQLAKLTNGSGSLIVQYTYDALGQLTQKQNGNGTFTTYAYDGDGNLTKEVNYANSAGNVVNSSFTYTYNLLDELTSYTDASANTTTYSYDAAGQLTGIVLPNGGGTISYSYNAAGDRTQQVVSGSTTTYASNSDNEITSAGSTTYTYTANGNLATATNSGGTTTYAYNDLNELTSITAPGGTVTTFQYSPLGYLVGENVGGTQTSFQVDPTSGDSIESTYTGGALTADYVDGLGLASTTGPSGTGYYDFNGGGDTVGVTGATGAYVNQYSELPFGETTTISATLPNLFTFGAQHGAVQLGGSLFAIGSRDYTPATGQFLSDSPILQAGGGANARLFEGNNPLAPGGTGATARIPAAGVDVASNFAGAPIGNPGDVSDSSASAPSVSSAFHAAIQPATWTATAEPGRIVAPMTTDASLAAMDAQLGDGFKSGAAPGLMFSFSPDLKVLKLPTLAGATKASGTTINKKSTDPNAMIGPIGAGAANYILDGGTLPYAITIENDGSVAALAVSYSEQLDPSLNWSTFQLGSFGFGSINVAVPAGLTQYQTTVSYQNTDGTSLNVLVSINFNVATGLLTATFTSIDPTTGQTPAGITDGFLYPDNASGAGEGYIRYTIQPLPGLAANTTINQSASVVFDTNAPVTTKTITNTIDGIPPSSSVNALPNAVTPTFPVSWSGSDASGPGIATYSVFVSVNGGAFTPWLTNTTATSAAYTGVPGDTYAFYSVATDAAGLVQPTPSGAQASTLVSTAGSTVSLSSSTDASGAPITVTLQSADAGGNPLSTGGLTVVFSLVNGTGGQGTFGNVKDNGDGTYTATFTGTIAGSNAITATIDGQAIATTPPPITVTPGTASPANSVMSVASGSVQSGLTDVVTLHTVDAAGNKLTSGGLTVQFGLVNPTGATGTFTSETDNGDGTYSAIFTGKLAGSNAITATINSQSLTSTAASITVTTGPASAATSQISVASGSVASGSTDTITLQAEDAAGNDLTSGGLTVQFGLGNGVGGGTISGLKDNGDGTYTATFTAGTAGGNTITATIDGQTVTSPLPSITVTPGPASAATSVVTLSSNTLQSGGTDTVTLQAEDAAGNDLTSGGLTVQLGLGAGAATGVFSNMKDNGDGTYTATFTGALVGGNTITATINGQKVTTPAPSFTVTPGAVVPANSLVSVASPTVQSGVVDTVTLQARDAAGNDVPTGGLTIAFGLGTGAATGQFGSVKDNGDGTYTATFTGALAGANTITAMANGQTVTTGAPAITVTPGQLDPANALVTTAYSSVQAGGSINVTLQARDAAGNNLTTTGLAVVFSLGSSTSGGQGTFGNVNDNGDGTYTTSFTGGSEGSNTITATVNGQALTTSPAPITVTSGSASLATSVVRLSTASVQSGSGITVTLQAEDSAGNDLTSGGLVVGFGLGQVGGGQGTFTNATDHGDGTYTATFTGTIAGANTITATIDGQPVTTAAPTISVTAGPADPSNSVVTINSGSLQSGSAATVTLQARDAAGNDVSTGGLTVVFGLGSSTGGQGTFGLVQDNGNGTYTASFAGTLAGANTITATANGQTVATGAPAIAVTPGPVSLKTSTISVSSGTLQSNGSITVTLQTRDAAGNDLTSGGLTIAFALGSAGGGQGSFSNLTDYHDGTYSATFTGTIAGANTITATVGGQPVTSTAPAITVTPGAVSLANSTIALANNTVQSGSTDRITLQARDSQGNDMTSGGLTVAFALGSSSGGQGTISSVTDNHDGTYTALFTGTIAGANTITATIGGRPITTTAPAITVTPGSPSPAKSVISIASGTVQSGGAGAVVTLQFRDSSGNVVASGNPAVVFGLGSGAATGKFTNPVNNGDGTYTATFTGVLAGTNTITSTIDGQPVTTTAPTVTVTAGAVSAANSVVTVASGSVQSGSTDVVTLVTKDAAGNTLTSGGLTVAFGLGAGPATGTFTSLTDQGNGTYTATFTGVLAGASTVTAIIDGQSVSTSAPAIAVTPGPVDPANSLVQLAHPKLQLGGVTAITVQARDQAGNSVPSGGLAISFALGSSTGAKGTIKAVTDNHEGTYSASFTGTSDGANTLVPTINGSSYPGLAANVSVTGAAFSAARSTVQLSSATVASGSPIKVTLQAEDARGNKETGGGLIVVFKLATTKGGQGTFSAVTDNGDCTYTATFSGTRVGVNSITATINGANLTSRLPAITVTPGPLSLTNSLVAVSTKSLKAGAPVTVTVTPRDAAGNTITASGTTVALAQGGSGGTGVFSTPKRNRNGSFTATFTGNLAGSNTIVASIDGRAVTAPPPAVAIAPGGASPAKSLVSVSSAQLTAGTSTTVTLQAVDAYGNKETAGGLAVTFALAAASGAKGTFSSVKDNKNGTYTATFTGTLAGANSIVATINRVRVASTAPVAVTPGLASPAKSTVAVSSTKASVGKTVTVTLQARDAEGNQETTGGLIVAFVLVGGKGGQGTLSPVQDNGNGAYTAVFTATSAGVVILEGEIGGTKLTSVAPAITVAG